MFGLGKLNNSRFLLVGVVHWQQINAIFWRKSNVVFRWRDLARIKQEFQENLSMSNACLSAEVIRIEVKIMNNGNGLIQA